MEGQANFPKWELPGVFDLTRTCPRQLTDTDAHQWIAIYQHYRAGHLLCSGGVLDQPAPYFEAMNIIANWVAKEREKATG